MTLAALIAVILGKQRNAVAHDNNDECDGSLLYTDVLGIVGTPGVQAGLYGVAGSDNALVPFNASAGFHFCANPCLGVSSLNRVKDVPAQSDVYVGPPFPPRKRSLFSKPTG